MSGVKHTPGPWITFQPRGDGSVPVRTDGLGLTICYVHDGAICDAIANARLIAAAPDLLAIAIKSHEPYEGLSEDDIHSLYGPEEAELALSLRAALAKATTQQGGR